MILLKKAPYKVKWDKVSTFDITQELLRRYDDKTILKNEKKSNINFRKFKKSKIAIYCKNESEAKQFLLECDMNDILMGGIFKASDFHHDATSPYYYYMKESINGLVHSSLDWIESHSMKIKEYSEVTK